MLSVDPGSVDWRTTRGTRFGGRTLEKDKIGLTMEVLKESGAIEFKISISVERSRWVRRNGGTI